MGVPDPLRATEEDPDNTRLVYEASGCDSEEVGAYPRTRGVSVPIEPRRTKPTIKEQDFYDLQEDPRQAHAVFQRFEVPILKKYELINKFAS